MKNTTACLAAFTLTGVLLLSFTRSSGAQETFTLVHSDELSNHWPGVDGMIGTADDVVSAEPSQSNGSAANTAGSLSYNAFDFGMGVIPDADLFPPERQAVTFLESGNTVTIDMEVASGGGGPLILGWDVSGTEPFPGHGPFSSVITAVNSGSYDVASGAFTQNVDFSATLLSGQANSSSFDISGNAWVVPAAEFDAGVGDSYVDSVLIPIARSMNATAMVYLMGSGTVPAADNSGFPEMGITAALFGLAGVDDNGGGDPLPDLHISPGDNGNVLVSWAASNTADPVLQSAESIVSPTAWEDIQPPYTVDGDNYVYTIETDMNALFFRLRKNP